MSCGELDARLGMFSSGCGRDTQSYYQLVRHGRTGLVLNPSLRRVSKKRLANYPDRTVLGSCPTDDGWMPQPSVLRPAPS